MGNSNTNSTKASVLEKIVKRMNSNPSENSGFNYKMGEKEWTLDEVGKKIIVNPCIKTLVAGLTLPGSIYYAIGRGVYKFEKKMGEEDSEMNKRYELSIKQHYIEKYRSRRDKLTFH